MRCANVPDDRKNGRSMGAWIAEAGISTWVINRRPAGPAATWTEPRSSSTSGKAVIWSCDNGSRCFSFFFNRQSSQHIRVGHTIGQGEPALLKAKPASRRLGFRAKPVFGFGHVFVRKKHRQGHRRATVLSVAARFITAHQAPWVGTSAGRTAARVSNAMLVTRCDAHHKSPEKPHRRGRRMTGI